jgi:hypothetical protein
LPGGPGAESKLEEDVGPLAARQGDVTPAVVVAKPRSARSQYARSTKQPVRPEELPRTLRDVAKLYGTFEESLGAHGGAPDMSAELRPSPSYRERVFESGKVKLAGDTKAEFSVTLWYEDPGTAGAPALAEVSFKYDVPKKEDLPREAAHQALALFLAMQDLGWADPGAPTKTALVSPPPAPACKAPRRPAPGPLSPAR